MPTSTLKRQALRTVVESSRLFSLDLYKAIIEGKESNLICSPISVSIVLSMAAFGARGNTEEQLRSALHLPCDDNINKLGFRVLIGVLNKVKEVELRLANKVFIRSDFDVKPAFMSTMRDYFRSASQLVNFENSKEASDTINSWCAENTNDRIKQVIKPEDVNSLTTLVLVNAIYFKGLWENQFKTRDTRPSKFYVDHHTTKDVQMMTQTAEFNFGRLSNFHARYIELPYKHSNPKDAMSMFIILPNEKDGLKDLEANLHRVDFKTLHESGSLRKVDLKLPKFKLASTIKLNDVLKKMGMTDMFSGTSDFSGIADIEMVVSQVIQKAFIEVNEEGSEAAAVTAVCMRERSLPPQITSFVVNCPFFCTIVATERGAQLFNARVLDPTLN